MKSIDQLNSKISYVFTDIDDTLTLNGQLPADSYKALWDLHNNGIKVIPITGRPAGWCELIARMWPVAGVVGENGGLYYRYADKKMKRHYAVDEPTRKSNRQKLNKICDEVLKQVPGSAVASDQFCRELDLAIDFCEDVPALPKDQVQKIVAIFENHGAIAKVSSIHVNGWFGNYDKLTMCKHFCEKELGLDLDQSQSQIAFVGDSPNDEPMFEYFKNSVAVANINDFLDEITHKPKFVCSKEAAGGFVEFAKKVL